MAKPVWMLKLDPETYQLIEDVSGWLGMDPATFTDEAVKYFLDIQREKLIERVQERLHNLFDTLDQAQTPKNKDPWATGAPESWVPKKGGWGGD